MRDSNVRGADEEQCFTWEKYYYYISLSNVWNAKITEQKEIKYFKGRMDVWGWGSHNIFKYFNTDHFGKKKLHLKKFKKADIAH